MRKLIAGMKSSVDGKIEGPEGYADWVEAWSDSYDLIPQIDACLLGANMYPGYEQYWTAVQNEPDKPLSITGKVPTPDEVEYARFATQTPHHVLSSTDEVRLIVYPLIAGEGKALFATTARRRALELRSVQRLEGGRVSLIYGILLKEQPGCCPGLSVGSAAVVRPHGPTPAQLSQ
jgi:hypothetical protein